MAGRTISEKILARKSGQDARAGDLVVCEVDCALGTDGSVPMALDYFKAVGRETVRDPKRFGITLHEADKGIRSSAHRRNSSRFAGRTLSPPASER